MSSGQRLNLSILVESTASAVGRNAPRIADAVLSAGTFPRTTVEADLEGVSGIFRTGLISEVRRILKAKSPSKDQVDFSEISEQFRPLARQLQNKAYYVQSLEQHVMICDLIRDPRLLDDARRFLRSKAEGSLEEADRLDRLYVAVISGSDA